MPDISADTRAIVDAVQDLTRVTIALHGNFASRSDAVRRLAELSIAPARIATILAMSPGDVHSALAKAKKRESAIADGGNGRASRSRRTTRVAETADAAGDGATASQSGGADA